MTTPAQIWTERLRRADAARCEGPDSWWRAAWESHRQFAGRFTTEGQRHSDGAVTMNLQYAATRTLHAGILPKNMRLKVKAIITAEEAAAYRATIVGNWAFHRNRMNRVADVVELNGQTKGVGLSYTTWGGRVTPEMLQDAQGQLRATIGKGKTDTAQDEEIRRTLAMAFPTHLHLQNLPHIKPLDPYDFLGDPEAIWIDEMGWAAHRYYLTKREALELKAVGFYTAPASAMRFDPVLKSTQILNGDEQPERREADLREHGIDAEAMDEFQRYEAWIVHDFRRHEVFHLLTGMDQFARAPRPIPEWYRPYHDYAPNGTGDTFWTKPDSWMYLPAQKALNSVMNGMVRYADTMGKMPWFYAEGDEEFATRLAEAQPGEGIAVSSKTAQLWHQIGRMSTDFGQIPEALRDIKPELAAIITQMSAISETAQGLLVKGVTATQARLSAGGQSLRSGYNRRLLTDWAGGVGETTVQLLQKLMLQEEAIPILGELQAGQWGSEDVRLDARGRRLVDVQASQLAGHFDYEVVAGDGAEQLQAEQQNMALQATNFLSNFLAMGLVRPQVLLPWLADKFSIPPDVIDPNPVPQPQFDGVQGQPVNREPTARNGPPGGRSPVGDLANRQRTPTMASESGATERPSAVPE